MEEDKYDKDGLDTYIICVKHSFFDNEILGIRLKYSNLCKTKEEKEKEMKEMAESIKKIYS